MVKYYVNNYDGTDCIYEGYDYETAARICHNYNKCCGSWYIDEEEVPDYDRKAVEVKYGLEDGELDGVDLATAEKMIGCEDGELGRYIWDNDAGCYFYQEEEEDE